MKRTLQCMWSRLSVRRKLTAIIMVVSLFTLALAGSGVIAYEYISAREQLIGQVDGVAGVISASSAAAVQFRDPVAAGEALAALRTNTDIEGARIDLVDGSQLAGFGLPSGSWPRVTSTTVTRAPSSVVVSRPIVVADRIIGTIHVRAGLGRVTAQLRRYLQILSLVLVFATLAAYFMSKMLQRFVSAPIMHLVDMASQVSATRNYRLRAAKRHEDELGLLVDEFNRMLDRIERRDAELQKAHDLLEARVAERTRTLELEIVERRRTENELIVAKASAEEASVAKSAFLANMSHELRTPLNAIIGYSEMLREDADDQGMAGCVTDIEKIITAGRHLLALINAVLDLSKIEAGRMELDREVFDPADVVRETVATTTALAQARGNTIEVQMAPGVGPMYSDRLRLQQVLLNLLSNACKFTKDGRVFLTVAQADGPAGVPWIEIRVRDTGIGMTPEQVSRLFQEFSQGDVSTTRRYGGTGLGLAISQRLCSLLGGTISVESEAGVGSTFFVHLPVGAGAPRPAARPERRVEPAVDGDGRRRVLIIDDDAGARAIVARMLKRAGIDVLEAARAEDGLDMMQEQHVDALLLDVILPGRSGWSLLEALKQDPTLASTPVVVVSVHDNRQKSISLGAVDHVTKPVNADALLVAVRAACASGGRRRHVCTPASVSPVRVAEEVAP